MSNMDYDRDRYGTRDPRDFDRDRYGTRDADRDRDWDRDRYGREGTGQGMRDTMRDTRDSIRDNIQGVRDRMTGGRTGREGSYGDRYSQEGMSTSGQYGSSYDRDNMYSGQNYGQYGSSGQYGSQFGAGQGTRGQGYGQDFVGDRSDLPSGSSAYRDQGFGQGSTRDQGFGQRFGGNQYTGTTGNQFTGGTGRDWQVPGPFVGKGPKGYTRSDERIREEVSDRLAQHGQIDATDIEVVVMNGEVTLGGTVNDRQQKRLAEDTVESVPGVKDVNNQIKVRQGILGQIADAITPNNPSTQQTQRTTSNTY